MPQTIQYDNIASFTFAITILGLFLIPATLFHLKHLCCASKKSKKSKKKKQDVPKGTMVGTIIYSLFLLFLWWVLISLSNQVASASEEVYDPYAILGVDPAASAKEIKRAYRKLSLVNHPDRGGSQDAFTVIAEAYGALTDETARKNYEEYGHPSGPQAMSVSMALPTFLTDTDNQNIVLVFYLLLIVFGFPGLVWYCLRSVPSAKPPPKLPAHIVQWLMPAGPSKKGKRRKPPQFTVDAVADQIAKSPELNEPDLSVPEESLATLSTALTSRIKRDISDCSVGEVLFLAQHYEGSYQPLVRAMSPLRDQIQEVRERAKAVVRTLFEFSIMTKNLAWVDTMLELVRRLRSSRDTPTARPTCELTAEVKKVVFYKAEVSVQVKQEAKEGSDPHPWDIIIVGQHNKKSPPKLLGYESVTSGDEEEEDSAVLRLELPDESKTWKLTIIAKSGLLKDVTLTQHLTVTAETDDDF